MTSSEITVIISAISVAMAAIGAIVGIIGARRNARKEYATDGAERAKLAEALKYVSTNVDKLYTKVDKIDEKIDHMTAYQTDLAKELVKTSITAENAMRRVEALERNVVV